MILYFKIIKCFCVILNIPRYILATDELGELEFELSEREVVLRVGTMSIVVGRYIPLNLKFLSPTLNINWSSAFP